MGNKNVFNADASSSIVRYYRLGRHALLTAFNILQIKKGDIVLVPAFICRDLLASIHAVGAIPGFYELDEGLKPVNLPFIEGVRAVIAVNYFGFPQNLLPFREYCQTSGATLIEDNAHGFLSCDETGALLGSRGDLGFFSIRKTFELPDGAMVMINDSKFIDRLPTQLSPRKESLSLGLRIKSGLSWLQRKSGINFLMMGRYIARLIRYWRTGYSIMPLAPENEFEMPAEPAPHAYLFKVLPGIDQKREINRRRTLYDKMHKRFASLDIQPVFDSLPEGTAPYCYPFFAAKETAAKAVQIANGMGLDCTYWPDLPSAIEADAPFHYRSLLIINFLC